MGLASLDNFPRGLRDCDGLGEIVCKTSKTLVEFVGKSSPGGGKGQRVLWEALTIVAFLGLLWMPTLDHFFGLDRAPEQMENRRPAQWPEFRGLAWSRDYVAGLEGYFNDHFGFRNRLVRWNHRWKWTLFHDATGGEVLIGRDGWLYYTGCDMLAHWNRQKMWTEWELEQWRRLLEMRRDRLRERGCGYMLVIAPDKHTVYPEHLPEWMERSDKPSKTEQLVNYLKAHSTVEVLDLTEALVQAKPLGVEYFNTDTHWNLFGAYVGCRAVIEAMAGQMPGLTRLPANAYGWKPGTREPGDLAMMLGAREAHPETQAMAPLPQAELPRLETLRDPARFPWPEEDVKKPAYTVNEKASGKALLFHDSFAGSWLPFLGQHFREVIYIWQREWDWALIEREKPDVVLDQYVERFLNLEDPGELAEKENASAVASRRGR